MTGRSDGSEWNNLVHSPLPTPPAKGVKGVPCQRRSSSKPRLTRADFPGSGSPDLAAEMDNISAHVMPRRDQCSERLHMERGRTTGGMHFAATLSSGSWKQLRGRMPPPSLDLSSGHDTRTRVGTSGGYYDQQHARLLLEEREAHRREADKLWQRVAKAQERAEEERMWRREAVLLLQTERLTWEEEHESSLRTSVELEETARRAVLLQTFWKCLATGKSPVLDEKLGTAGTGVSASMSKQSENPLPRRPSTRCRKGRRKASAGQPRQPQIHGYSEITERIPTSYVRDSDLLRALQQAESRIAYLEEVHRTTPHSPNVLFFGISGDESLTRPPFPHVNASVSHHSPLDAPYSPIVPTLTILPDDEENSGRD